MGGGGSHSSSSSTIDISTLNQSVSNYLNQNSASSTAQSSNYENLSLNIGNMCGGCDIDASQNIKSSVQAVASLSAENVQAIKSALMASANTQIDQAAQAQTGAFAPPIGGGSSSATTSNYKNSVQNIVENNMTVQNVTSAYASAFNSINKTITINSCGNCGNSQDTTQATLNASQNIVSDLAAKAIVNTVASQISNLDTQSSTTTGVSQSSTSKVSGLDDVIKSIGDLLAGCGLAALSVYAGPILLCLIICCSLCCSSLVGAVATAGASGGGGAPAAPVNNGAANAAKGLAVLGKVKN